MFGIVVNHSQFSLSQHWKRHGFNVTMRSQGCLLSPSDDIFTLASFVRSPFRCLRLNNIAIFLMSCLGGFAREFIRSIEHGLHVSKHVNHSVHIKSNLEQSVVILLKSLLDSRNFLLHFLICSVLEASFALLLCLRNSLYFAMLLAFEIDSDASLAWCLLFCIDLSFFKCCFNSSPVRFYLGLPALLFLRSAPTGSVSFISSI